MNKLIQFPKGKLKLEDVLADPNDSLGASTYYEWKQKLNEKRLQQEDAKKTRERKTKLIKRHCRVCGANLKPYQKNYCGQKCWAKVNKAKKHGQVSRMGRYKHKDAVRAKKKRKALN